MRASLRLSLLALLSVGSACTSSEDMPSELVGTGGFAGAAPGAGALNGMGGVAAPASGGTSAGGGSGATPGAGGTTLGGNGGGGGDVSIGAVMGVGGSVPGTGGVPVSAGGASTARSGDAGTPPRGRLTAGVNVHDYPKPSAYGYVAADGKDRMGDGLVQAGITVTRAGTIGDTTFLTRLHDFGVTEAVLLLSASAHGKPFDPTTVGPALQKSLAVAQAIGLTIQVEGLNEWDLFNSRTYNAGVVPAGMSESDFVLFTQKALYDAAHPLGLTVLGPSVGHPNDPASLAFFPDVSAYVDVVNAHIYFGSSPETIPLAQRVADDQRFQGTGKPLWVTETGISSYGAVTPAAQADVIRRGLAFFDGSGLVQRAYVYELLDDQLPGFNGTTFIPDSAEYHFGLFLFDGTAKPAQASVHDFIVGAP